MAQTMTSRPGLHAAPSRAEETKDGADARKRDALIAPKKSKGRVYGRKLERKLHDTSEWAWNANTGRNWTHADGPRARCEKPITRTRARSASKSIVRHCGTMAEKLMLMRLLKRDPKELPEPKRG